jgi:hypothetical protein
LYKIHKAKHDILTKIEEEKVRRVTDPRRADRDFMEALKSEGGFEETVANSSVEAVKGLQFAVTPNKKE